MKHKELAWLSTSMSYRSSTLSCLPCRYIYWTMNAPPSIHVYVIGTRLQGTIQFSVPVIKAIAGRRRGQPGVVTVSDVGHDGWQCHVCSAVGRGLKLGPLCWLHTWKRCRKWRGSRQTDQTKRKQAKQNKRNKTHKTHRPTHAQQNKQSKTTEQTKKTHQSKQQKNKANKTKETKEHETKQRKQNNTKQTERPKRTRKLFAKAVDALKSYALFRW